MQELAEKVVFLPQLPVGTAEKDGFFKGCAHAFRAGCDKERAEVHLAGGSVGDHIAQKGGIVVLPQILQRRHHLPGGFNGKNADFVGQQFLEHLHVLGDVGIPHHRHFALAWIGALQRAQHVIHRGGDLHHRQGDGFLQQLRRAPAGDDHVEIAVESFLGPRKALGQVAHFDGQLDIAVSGRHLLQQRRHPRIGTDGQDPDRRHRIASFIV